jgi:hypothetical protein
MASKLEKELKAQARFQEICKKVVETGVPCEFEEDLAEAIRSILDYTGLFLIKKIEHSSFYKKLDEEEDYRYIVKYNLEELGYSIDNTKYNISRIVQIVEQKLKKNKNPLTPLEYKKPPPPPKEKIVPTLPFTLSVLGYRKLKTGSGPKPANTIQVSEMYLRSLKPKGIKPKAKRKVKKIVKKKTVKLTKKKGKTK